MPWLQHAHRPGPVKRALQLAGPPLQLAPVETEPLRARFRREQQYPHRAHACGQPREPILRANGWTKTDRADLFARHLAEYHANWLDKARRHPKQPASLHCQKQRLKIPAFGKIGMHGVIRRGLTRLQNPAATPRFANPTQARIGEFLHCCGM